jgi:hypothetical protein
MANKACDNTNSIKTTDSFIVQSSFCLQTYTKFPKGQKMSVENNSRKRLSVNNK